MAVIDYIDVSNPAAVRIHLSSSTISGSFLPVDMYYEMVALRAANQSLRSYPVFLKAFGNVAKGGGKFTERYIQCMNGCRAVPFDVTQTLNVTGTIITDTGQEGTLCFDRTTLTAQVDINYVPPQVEVIQISSGSGLSAAEQAQLQSVYDITGGGGSQVGTQLILYAADNTTEVARFDLYDSNNVLTSDMSKVVKQVRV